MLDFGLSVLARRDETLGHTVDRRDFLKICTLAAAAVGLPASAGRLMAEEAAKGVKPSVIWLSYQECTGCTETLLRTSHPQLDELILDLISLDYHEALMAPSGHLAEEARMQAMDRHDGQFVLVVEGAIPTKDGGIYCKIGGRTAVDTLQEAAERAGAIVAIGSCASWGGIPSSPPNPTGATGAPQILEGKTVVSIPGCPPNPYNFLGTVLQYATFGTLPELDELGRPKFSYGRTIHEHCPRRAHFDAGRFVQKYGDEGHRQGWCLYKMGCKGPQTHAPCSTNHFNEVVGAWPIGTGHPCFGCTEEKLAFKVGMHETVQIDRPTPPDTYAPIAAEQGEASPWAAGAAGAVVGGLVGAGLMTARKLGSEPPSEPSEPEEEE
ncbi:MAG: hydrogenase small subunit [Acidobacteriota bacterium]|jgi:hydrogenase small subunit